MSIVVHNFEQPDRFVAGTVGEPGQRTFFLQAREGTRITSVALEKQQVSVLAERVDLLLDEALRRSGGDVAIPAVAPVGVGDQEPLDLPIVEEFRVGTITLSWDSDEGRVVIELFPVTDETVVMQSYDEEGDGTPGEPVATTRSRSRSRSRPARCWSSSSSRRTRGPSSVVPCPSSRPAGRPASSAATRSTLTGTCAREPTGSGALQTDQPDVLDDASRRPGPRLTVTWRSRVGWSPRPTRASSAWSRWTASRSPASTSRSPGERPLWDFPDGTPRRPRGAARLVSEAGGFGHRASDRDARRPRTAVGMCQRWVRRRPGARPRRRRTDRLRRAGMDRRARGRGPPRTAGAARARRRRPAPRHGAARRRDQQRRPQGRPRARRARAGLARLRLRPRRVFHEEPKLRTVLWGWADEPLRDRDTEMLRRARRTLPG